MPESSAPANSLSRATVPLRLVCSEIWGGNRPIHCPIELPGIRGILYSRPCDGGRGGDVHYLSVCGSGLLSRLCIADVAGHGEPVAAISSEMHTQLRRSMNQPDQRRVLRELNRRLVAMGLNALTTAAAMSYYATSRQLTVGYAGHPPGWYYRRGEQRWARLDPADDGRTALNNLALAIDAAADFTQSVRRTDVGDRALLLTDGVLEAVDAAGRQYGHERVLHILDTQHRESCAAIADALLADLAAHIGRADFAHDDVTFLLVEFIAGLRGPAVWHAIKNRAARSRGNAAGYAAQSPVRASSSTD